MTRQDSLATTNGGDRIISYDNILCSGAPPCHTSECDESIAVARGDILRPNYKARGRSLGNKHLMNCRLRKRDGRQMKSLFAAMSSQDLSVHRG